VSIGDDLDDLVVLSSDLITGKIPDSSLYNSPANLIDRQESVIITDTKGRTTVGYDKFTIQVTLCPPPNLEYGFNKYN
jgi:hypothetical protein